MGLLGAYETLGNVTATLGLTAASGGFASQLSRFGMLSDTSLDVQTVYHAISNLDRAQSVMEGINSDFLNSRSRFNKAFYVASDVATSVAEVNSHSMIGAYGIRFNFNASQANVLDLTNPDIAIQYGYYPSPISNRTRDVAVTAQQQGFNVIRFNSLRGSGINYAILNNFNEILTPQETVSIQPELNSVSPSVDFYPEIERLIP